MNCIDQELGKPREFFFIIVILRASYYHLYSLNGDGLTKVVSGTQGNIVKVINEMQQEQKKMGQIFS